VARSAKGPAYDPPRVWWGTPTDRDVASQVAAKGAGPPPSADSSPFLDRLRHILAEHRRHGGHSRRLNSRRSRVRQIIFSAHAPARILSMVDSCLESTARLPRRKVNVIRHRREDVAAILLDHLNALHCHPAFLASPGTDRTIVELRRLSKDLNVERWRVMQPLTRSERTALKDYRTPKQTVLDLILNNFLREENIERYGLNSEEALSPKKAQRMLVTGNVRALSRLRVPPRLIARLFGDLRLAEVELLGAPPLTARLSAANAKKIVQRSPTLSPQE